MSVNAQFRSSRNLSKRLWITDRSQTGGSRTCQ